MDYSNKVDKMFSENGEFYRVHFRENFSRQEQYQIAQAKFFEDAYVNGEINPLGARPVSPAVEKLMQEQAREMAIYQQQLMAIELRLWAEIYFMAAIYMAEINNYYQSHHLYSTFGHWARPRTWAHAAQKTGRQLEHQWHEWGQEASGFTNRLITDARHSLGQPVWAFTKFASVCQSGYLGCAATVSELLQESGVKIPGSAGVYGLVDQLSAAGWQKIKVTDKQQFLPGDVVFGVHGSHGHIGIISQINGDQVLVCDNSSSAGVLKERTIESGGSFTPNGRFAGNLYVMRANGIWD